MSILPKRKYVRMHDQIGRKTTCDRDRMNCPFHYVHPAKTDESKSSVRNNLQRTGAEINQLFSFESLLVKLWRKAE